MIGAQPVVTVTEATFDRTVLQARIPVVVDVWAEWCPPCRWLSPIVQDLAAEQAGRLLVAKVDADQNPGLVRRYGTLSLPTLLVFVDGVERARIVGARPKPRGCSPSWPSSSPWLPVAPVDDLVERAPVRPPDRAERAAGPRARSSAPGRTARCAGT